MINLKCISRHLRGVKIKIIPGSMPPDPPPPPPVVGPSYSSPPDGYTKIKGHPNKILALNPTLGEKSWILLDNNSSFERHKFLKTKVIFLHARAYAWHYLCITRLLQSRPRSSASTPSDWETHAEDLRRRTRHNSRRSDTGERREDWEEGAPLSSLLAFIIREHRNFLFASPHFLNTWNKLHDIRVEISQKEALKSLEMERINNGTGSLNFKQRARHNFYSLKAFYKEAQGEVEFINTPSSSQWEHF